MLGYITARAMAVLNGHAYPLPILKVYTSCWIRTNIYVKVVLTDASHSLTVIRTGVDQHYTATIYTMSHD